jgi:hypothetical protein
MMKIEEARLLANTYLRSPDQLTHKEWYRARRELKSFVSSFLRAREYVEALGRQFVLGPVPSRERANLSPFLHELAGERENRIAVREALIKFESYLDESNLNSIPRQRSFRSLNWEKLLRSSKLLPSNLISLMAALEFFNNRPR